MLDRLHAEFAELERKYRYLVGSHNSKAVERGYRPVAIRLLREAGIPDLRIHVCGNNDPVDLIVNGLAVELKIARDSRKRPGPYFRFLLRDHNNNHYLNGHYLYLLCVYDSTCCAFIIPTERVGKRRTIEITSDPFTYGGQWAMYRNAFDYLRGGNYD